VAVQSKASRVNPIEGVSMRTQEGGEREEIGRGCDVALPSSISDTDTMLVTSLSDAEGPKGTREAEGNRCSVSNDRDDRMKEHWLYK